MSEQEQNKNVNQDISDAAEAKQTGELSEKDLAGVAGGNKYADDFKQINTKLDALATTKAQTIKTTLNTVATCGTAT